MTDRRIQSFYDPTINGATDEADVTLDTILAFTDSQLEYKHDYIQWLFPLPEPSPVNPWAPVITKQVREEFLANAKLQTRLDQALARMLRFYGFDVTFPNRDNNNNHDNGGDSPTITPLSNFSTVAARTWRKARDHNHLRISRILRCLRVLGREQAAEGFHAVLVEHAEGRVSATSMMFWERAAKRPLHLAPQDEDESANRVDWLRGG